MSRNIVSRCLTALVVVAVLALAAPAQAAGPGSFFPGQGPQVLESLWSWLVGLLPQGAQTAAGCNIDPNGKPQCAPATAQSDLGCGIDPNGNPRCTQ